MNKVKVLVITVLALLSFGISFFVQTPHRLTSPNSIAQSLPVLVIDSEKMPAIAAHIRQAQAQGYRRILTRLTDKDRITENRTASCGNFARPAGYECDEYPFASTYEGGQGASVAPVLPHEQRVQGGTISAFYQNQNISDGSKFIVCVGTNQICES